MSQFEIFGGAFFCRATSLLSSHHSRRRTRANSIVNAKKPQASTSYTVLLATVGPFLLNELEDVAALIEAREAPPSWAGRGVGWMPFPTLPIKRDA